MATGFKKGLGFKLETTADERDLTIAKIKIYLTLQPKIKISVI